VTGAVSRQEVWNFPLQAGGGEAYARAAGLRAAEILADAAAAGRRPSAASAVGTAGQPGRAAERPVAPTSASAGGGASGPGSGEGAPAASAAPAAPGAPPDARGGAPAPAAPAAAAAAAQARAELVAALEAQRAVAPLDLLYGDREATTPARKATQAELLRRAARDLRAG
jgi:hypothetical protein